MSVAYSYLRFSTPEQALGDSHRRQTELAEKYAAAHGMVLDTELRMADEGISAFRAKNVSHGALGRFLRAIEDGVVKEGSFLLVENLDRVSRASAWDAMPVFQMIINAGVTIVTLQDEKTWSRAEMRADPYRIFESLIVMIRANEESEIKSRRLKASWTNKRQHASSKPLTSRAPAWLLLEGEPAAFRVLEDRAAVVRRVYSMTLDGVGQHKIAETLNREAVPTFGKADYWQRSYVKKLLESPAVVGTLVPHELSFEGGKRTRIALESVPGYYPPIVSQDDFDSVRSMGGLRAPRDTYKAPALTNMLAGLLRCPVCEGTMTRVTKGKGGGQTSFVCVKAKAGAGCRYKSVSQEKVESALLGDAEYLMAQAPSASPDLDDQLDRVESEVDAIESQINNLVEELSHRRSAAVSRSLVEYEEILVDAKARRDALVDTIHATATSVVIRRANDCLAVMKEQPSDVGRLNVLFRQLFSAVYIDYEQGHLSFVWKGGRETSLMFAWPTVEHPDGEG